MRSASRAVLVLVALIAALFYLACPAGGHLAHVVAKATPALCLAALSARVGGRGWWLVPCGLACCAAGDALLDLHGLFVAGMLAFLVGHAAFLVRFARQAQGLVLPILFLAGAWAGAALAATWPRLGDLRLPVVVYVFVICAMMWRAVAAAISRRSLPAWLGAVGALSFGLSDTLIALRSWGGMADPGGWVVMGLYWAGLAGLAASAVPDRRTA